MLFLAKANQSIAHRMQHQLPFYMDKSCVPEKENPTPFSRLKLKFYTHKNIPNPVMPYRLTTATQLTVCIMSGPYARLGAGCYHALSTTVFLDIGQLLWERNWLLSRLSSPGAKTTTRKVLPSSIYIKYFPRSFPALSSPSLLSISGKQHGDNITSSPPAVAFVAGRGCFRADPFHNDWNYQRVSTLGSTE